MIKKIISTLLLLTFLLGACTSTESTPTLAEPAISSAPESASEEAPAPNVTEQVGASREAVLSEFENTVTVQMKSSAEFTSAEVGTIIPLGGSVQTAEDSRAKLLLNPEGTIVRVGPSSLFVLSEMQEENGEPKTILELLFGKVFILLNGGSLDVQTPSGVASVRGSLLSVEFDPNTNRIRAVCLEGHCGLENEDGDEIDLVEGEAAMIDEEGVLSDVLEIDRDEIEEWLSENPELDTFLEELPDPEVFPDILEPEGFGGGDVGPDFTPDPDFDPPGPGGGP